MTSNPNTLSASYAQIAGRLLLSVERRPGACWVVTSAQRGDGVSTTALGLARALSTLMSDGLLIDANLRDPDLSNRFEGQATLKAPGLVQVIEENLSPSSLALQEHDFGDFAFLPAGAQLDDPIALLTRTRLADVLGQMAKEHGFVVIDTPAVEKGVDALCLGPYTDGCILAVRADRTGKRLLMRTRSKILEAGVTLRGAILTQQKNWVPRMFGSWL